MSQNYPPNAKKMVFKPIKGRSVTWRLWSREISMGIIQWYWYALGQAGYQPTQEEAMAAARRWIKDGWAGRDRM
jgi:hypothetical protein